MQPITSLTWLSAFATVGLLFAPFAHAQTPSTSQPAGFEQHSTPGQLVDAFNAVFGKQKPGVRANHAKGVDLEGTFRPSPSASSVSKAPHLQKASGRIFEFWGQPDDSRYRRACVTARHVNKVSSSGWFRYGHRGSFLQWLPGGNRG